MVRLKYSSPNNTLKNQKERRYIKRLAKKLDKKKIMTVGLYIPQIVLKCKNCEGLSFRRRRNPIHISIGFLLRRNDKPQLGLYNPTVIKKIVICQTHGLSNADIRAKVKGVAEAIADNIVCQFQLLVVLQGEIKGMIIGMKMPELLNKMKSYKVIILLCVVLFCVSYLPAKKVTPTSVSILRDTSKSDSNSEKPDPYYKPPLVIPSGFKIDSIEGYEAKQHLEYFIVLPMSGVKDFDKMIRNKIANYKTEYLKNLDAMISYDPRDTSYQSEFEVSPWSIYKDEKIISCPLIIYKSSNFAVHGVGDFESFNYDIKEQKAITFTDYFNVYSTEDTTSFIKTIKDVIAPLGDWFTQLNDLDFSIQKDSVSFNFGNYKIDCYAAGMFTARIAKTALRDKIKENYR